jgi:hypothetical protein
VDELNYEELDPGIRDTVRLLNEAGFETCDSGDGVSKLPEDYESGDALAFAHVVALVPPGELIPEAHRMVQVLGDHWAVEASYYPDGCFATLMARHKDHRENVQ